MIFTVRHQTLVERLFYDKRIDRELRQNYSDAFAELLREEYRAGYLAALEAVHDRYEFGPERTVGAFDRWLHERIIEVRQEVTADKSAVHTTPLEPTATNKGAEHRNQRIRIMRNGVVTDIPHVCGRDEACAACEIADLRAQWMELYRAAHPTAPEDATVKEPSTHL